MATEPLDLVALRALCDAASPGPWAYEEHEMTPAFRHESSIAGPDGDVVFAWWDDPESEAYGGIVVEDEDAAFIAAARDALPVLVATLARIEALADRLERNAANHTDEFTRLVMDNMVQNLRIELAEESR